MSEFMLTFKGSRKISSGELRDTLQENTSLVFKVGEEGGVLYVYCPFLAMHQEGCLAYIKISEVKGELYLGYSLSTNQYLLSHLFVALEYLGYLYNNKKSESHNDLAVPWQNLPWYQKLRYGTGLHCIF